MSALARPAASVAILLCLGIATATAQTAPPTTDGSQAPPVQAAPAALQESVQKDAIRVPAMGTTATPGAAEAKGAAPKKTRVASAKRKKHVRASRYIYPDDGEIVEVRPYYAPTYYYAPRPSYRIGHGIGPGFVYGW